MKDREAWTEWATRRKQRHEEREVSAIGSAVARTGQSQPMSGGSARAFAAPPETSRTDEGAGLPRTGALTQNGELGNGRDQSIGPALWGKPIVAGTLLHPLIALCRLHGLPEPRPEYAWHPTRRYRADYALVAERILIEVDGGLFIQGGHSRGAARLHDMEKDREATMLGWRTLRYPPNAESQIVADLKRILA